MTKDFNRVEDFNMVLHFYKLQHITEEGPDLSWGLWKVWIFLDDPILVVLVPQGR